VKKTKDPSKIDSKVWDEYIKDPKDLFDKEKIDERKNQNVKKRIKFDLHGFNLLDANYKVRELLNNCFEKKYSELLLITGKGIHSNIDRDVFKSKELGKLRFSIPEYINSEKDLKERILSISPASPEDGGDGAIIIKLKKL